MDIQEKQLAVYKKIVNGGRYNLDCADEVVSLINTEGYLEYLHNSIIDQLNAAVNTLNKTKFDKISVVMNSSKTSRIKLMNNFISEFSSNNISIVPHDYSKVPAEKIPYKYRLEIKWIKEGGVISVYFENKRKNNTTNIKVDFNLTKSREQALLVFEFIYNNLPKTKAVRIFRLARVTRLERYISLIDIPVWGVLISRSAIVKGTNSYDARGENNRIASSYYISKDNSKEVAVYDKYASDSRIYYDEIDKHGINPQAKVPEFDIVYSGDAPNLETKIEARNFKNRMNKRQRRKSMFFCSPSTFPSYLRSVHFYSPLVLREMNTIELKELIEIGFYNFMISKTVGSKNKLTNKYTGYLIDFNRFARKNIESSFSIVYSSFILDLSKALEIDLFDPDKPFNKMYNPKSKKRSC